MILNRKLSEGRIEFLADVMRARADIQYPRLPLFIHAISPLNQHMHVLSNATKLLLRDSQEEE